MLEFNEQHKSADLSPIKSKLDKAKRVGKVTICGILIASTLLFSGCGTKNKDKESFSPQHTAIVLHDETAIIIDVEYRRSFESYMKILTTTGEEIVVSYENCYIIEGENSREIAEEMAKKILGENATIIYYDEVIENVKSK